MTRDDILKALDQVIDPVSGRSIVQQNMVTGLVLREGHVGFALEVAARTGPLCRAAARCRRSRRQGLPGVLSVTAVLTAH